MRKRPRDQEGRSAGLILKDILKGEKMILYNN